MLAKEYFKANRDPYFLIQEILTEYKDYFLTKEEIYCHMPSDDAGIVVITISALENALRALAKCGCIKVEYANGRRYFGYMPENERKNFRY